MREKRGRTRTESLVDVNFAQHHRKERGDARARRGYMGPRTCAYDRSGGSESATSAFFMVA